MSAIDHARTLHLMAAKDIKALRGMTDGETFDDEIFGFHAQQAVEKSLKAWIAAIGGTFPLTHDLRLLLFDFAGTWKRDRTVQRPDPPQSLCRSIPLRTAGATDRDH